MYLTKYKFFCVVCCSVISGMIFNMAIDCISYKYVFRDNPDDCFDVSIGSLIMMFLMSVMFLVCAIFVNYTGKDTDERK